MTDSSVLIPNQQAVSSDVLYNMKASSVRGRAYRASILPTNGTKFDAQSLTVLYVPGGRRNTFLSCQDTYLRFTIYNQDAATNDLVIDGNASAFINRIDIFHASNLLETIQGYNIIYQYMLDNQLNVAQRAGLSAMYGCNSAFDGTRYGQTILKGAQLTVCVPILSGTIGLGNLKSLPIGQLNDDIRIEITWENINPPVLYVATGTTTVATAQPASTACWQITNCELECNIIELSDEGMHMVEQVTPFSQPVFIMGNSWRHYTANLTSGTSGTYSTLVPARFASLKTLHMLPQVASVTTAYDKYSICNRVNPNFAQLWYRLGAYIIPQKFINIQSGTTGGYAELFAENQRAWHALNHPEYAGSLPFSYFNVAHTADATTVGGGGILAANTGNNGHKNAFGYSQELETFSQRSDVLLSGVNTLSSQVFFEANIGTTAPNVAYTLHFYANYDHVLVLQDGILSVRF